MKPAQRKRSRDGCWTCRKRKKRCNSTITSCNACVRLNLVCTRKAELIWEDDVRRDGMRRRGPAKASTQPKDDDKSQQLRRKTISIDKDDALVETIGIVPSAIVPNRTYLKDKSRMHPAISSWTFKMTTTDWVLLDRYVQRFSRTYPTDSGPSNPFLSVLIPLAMQSRIVLHCLLALSTVQTWDNDCFVMETAMLKLRHQALRGCRELAMTFFGDEKTRVDLLASSVLLLLYEKLAGEGAQNRTPHLEFIARSIMQNHSSIFVRGSTEPSVLFLPHLFYYNDLVRSTSVETPTLSQFYLEDGEIEQGEGVIEVVASGRYYFPNLIARMSAGDLTITDVDIAFWDGRLDWMPSLSLNPPLEPILGKREPDEQTIIELYLFSALIYRRQCARRLRTRSLEMPITGEKECTGNNAKWAVERFLTLSEGSRFDTCLLWPIGIVARELTADFATEPLCVITKLHALEARLHMRHFGRVAQHLNKYWNAYDQGNHDENRDYILFG